MKNASTVITTAGIISLLSGVLVIVYPDITLLALAIITGISLFMFGLMGLVEGVMGGDDSGVRTLNIVLGLIAVIAGVVLIRRPGESLVAIVMVLGIWFVLSALVAFVRVLVQPGGRLLRAVGALAEPTSACSPEACPRSASAPLPSWRASPLSYGA